MEELYQILDEILLVIQFLAALTGFFYFFRLRKSYWKWFCVYLVIICIQEYLVTSIAFISADTKQYYNLFFGLPLEFIFLYWLYARQSLQKKTLFIVCTAIYITTCIIISSIEDVRGAISFCLNVGSLILIVLVVLEYLKQIRNDSILKFQENRMFYINFGVVLFYIGSLPFHVFQKYLYVDYKSVVEYYYVYFVVANCIMYLLFIASLVWGKKQS